ncbi:hypothetical protein CLOM_g12554 [Closterium sp. NIES-68]|nr:hypothetical protein CLOM_g12554 [Closterium sp. NIES-68]
MKRFLQDPKTTTLPNQAHGKPTNYQGEYLQPTNKVRQKASEAYRDTVLNARNVRASKFRRIVRAQS